VKIYGIWLCLRWKSSTYDLELNIVYSMAIIFYCTAESETFYCDNCDGVTCICYVSACISLCVCLCVARDLVNTDKLIIGVITNILGGHT
jgi:hypothetical protein